MEFVKLFTEKQEGGEDFKSADLYKSVLNIAIQGMTFLEMRERNIIVDLLEEADDTLTLEEKQWETLKDAFMQHRFPQAHDFIIRAGNELENAEKKDEAT